MGEKSGRRGCVPALLPHLTVSRHLLCSHPRTRTNQPLIYLLEPKLKPPRPRWDENKAFAGDNGSEKASQALESILVYFLASLFHGGPRGSSRSPLPPFSGALGGDQGQRWGKELPSVICRATCTKQRGSRSFPPTAFVLCSNSACSFHLGSGKREISKSSVMSQGHPQLRAFSELC